MANKAKRREKEDALTQHVMRLNSVLCQQKKVHGVKPPKKKSTSALYCDLSLGYLKEYEIRPIEGYTSKSFNLDKQYKGLLKHLYVKYPVPNFMYNMFLVKNHAGVGCGFEWFFCLAQGRSLQKMVKRLLTKKECIAFLSAPDDYSFNNAFWFAKLHHAGISQSIIHGLVVRKQIFRVSSYISSCNNGYCNIFSLRKYHAFSLKEIEKSRVTFEMSGAKIIQIRGSSNRIAKDDELKVIRKFALDNGFSVASTRW